MSQSEKAPLQDQDGQKISPGGNGKPEISNFADSSPQKPDENETPHDDSWYDDIKTVVEILDLNKANGMRLNKSTVLLIKMYNSGEISAPDGSEQFFSLPELDAFGLKKTDQPL